VSGKDVGGTMRAWVTEMGYPVVTIEETDQSDTYRVCSSLNHILSVCFIASLIAKVSQRRFLKVGLPTEEEDRVTWNINIGYISAYTKEVGYSVFATLPSCHCSLFLLSGAIL
jgi:hypothetical protein